MRIIFIITVLLSISPVFQGCGSKSKGSGGTKQKVGAAPDFQVQFIRLAGSPGGRSFKIHMRRAKGLSVDDITTLNVDRGSVGVIEVINATTLETTVTPDPAQPTGRYPVTIHTSFGDMVKRVPIVLDSIHERWGQPELFNGSANTEAWEDSPTVYVVNESNGTQSLYLGIYYSALDSRCLLGGASQANPYCTQILGTVTGPQRPNMPIANFVDDQGHIDQSLPYLLPGVSIPIVKPAAAMFVFKIDNDGYAGYLGTPLDPKAIYFENDDGLGAPAGMQFMSNNKGGHSLVYNFSNFTENTDGCPGYNNKTGDDIYILESFDFMASQTVLGHFQRVDPGQKFSDGSTNTNTLPCSELILTGHLATGLPPENAQNNPFVFGKNGSIDVVIWDREADSARHLDMVTLSPGGVFPTGPWSAIYSSGIFAAPPPYNGIPVDKKMPFLNQNEFCYSAGPYIECANYNGGSYTDNSSFGSPVLQMSGTGSSAHEGEIQGVGEPTIFQYMQQTCMSFSIAEQGPEPTAINFGNAWVCETSL